MVLRSAHETRRRTWLLAAGALVSLVLVLAASVPLAVGWLVERQASARGFVANVGSVALRPTRVWLRDVEVTHARVTRAKAELPEIEVRFGWNGVRDVVVHGGSIQLEGEPEQLFDQLAELRRRPAKDASGDLGSTGRQLKIAARGVTVEWPSVVNASGITLERRDGLLQARIDRLRTRLPWGALDANDVELAVEPSGLLIRRAKATRTHAVLRPPPADASPAPTRPNAAAATDSDVLRAFELDPERGRRWAERLRRLTRAVARRLPVDGKLELDGLHLTLHRGGQELNLGPARLGVERTATEVRVGLTPSAISPHPTGNESLELRLELPIETGAARLRVEGGPIALSRLGVREGNLGLTQTSRAQLELRLDVLLSPDGERAELDGSGALRQLSWSHPKVAPDVLADMTLSGKGRGELRLDGSALTIEAAELGFGAVTAQARLKLERGSKRLRFDAALEVPSASCQAMFDSLPSAIVPLLIGTRFDGTFSWQAAVTLDTDRPEDMKARWRMQNGCSLKQAPASAEVERFKRPFSRMVPAVDGEPLVVWSGPGTPDWVPLGEVSRFLQVAVLVTEDGGFWHHRGFDQGAIEGSIRQNVQAGRFVRGASTISMQLAKNLYLTRDKHLSRKVQEALLTMLLEQELSKAEILELYFNGIEFGPDVWGIRMAADHYFNTKPRELSLAQAFFLASILPNPKLSRFRADGTLEPEWRQHVNRLMQIAHQRNRITRDELEQGLQDTVQLGVPNLLTEEELEHDEPDWERELQ